MKQRKGGDGKVLKSMIKCMCGKDATHRAYLPIGNVYAGFKQVVERHFVCDYHARKARNKGFEVVSMCEYKEVK